MVLFSSSDYLDVQYSDSVFFLEASFFLENVGDTFNLPPHLPNLGDSLALLGSILLSFFCAADPASIVMQGCAICASFVIAKWQIFFSWRSPFVQMAG